MVHRVGKNTREVRFGMLIFEAFIFTALHHQDFRNIRDLHFGILILLGYLDICNIYLSFLHISLLLSKTPYDSPQDNQFFALSLLF